MNEELDRNIGRTLGRPMDKAHAATVLGITADSSLEDARKAFKDRTRLLHPDVHSSRSTRDAEAATQAMAQLNEAFEVFTGNSESTSQGPSSSSSSVGTTFRLLDASITYWDSGVGFTGFWPKVPASWANDHSRVYTYFEESLRAALPLLSPDVADYSCFTYGGLPDGFVVRRESIVGMHLLSSSGASSSALSRLFATLLESRNSADGDSYIVVDISDPVLGSCTVASYLDDDTEAEAAAFTSGFTWRP